MMFSGASPIYEQLAAYFRRLILVGAFRPGDPLPSVRDLALSERINPNTAQRAYSLLVEEGLVVSLPKKGYYVAENVGKDESHLKEALSSLLKEGYTKEDIVDALNALQGGGA